AGRSIDEIDPELERETDRRKRLRVVGNPIDAGHAIAAETDLRHPKIGISEGAIFHCPGILANCDSRYRQRSKPSLATDLPRAQIDALLSREAEKPPKPSRAADA